MNTPARLHKVEKPETDFDKYCKKIAPYVLFACICILIMLIFVILVRYGANLTGTEANAWYYHRGGV